MQITFDITKNNDVKMAWGFMCTTFPELMLSLSKELVGGVGPVINKQTEVPAAKPKQVITEPPPHSDDDRPGLDTKLQSDKEPTAEAAHVDPEPTPAPEAEVEAYTLKDVQDLIKANLAIVKTKRIPEEFDSFRKEVIALIEERYGVKASSLIPADRMSEAYGELQSFFSQKVPA